VLIESEGVMRSSRAPHNRRGLLWLIGFGLSAVALDSSQNERSAAHASSSPTIIRTLNVRVAKTKQVPTVATGPAEAELDGRTRATQVDNGRFLGSNVPPTKRPSDLGCPRYLIGWRRWRQSGRRCHGRLFHSRSYL